MVEETRVKVRGRAKLKSETKGGIMDSIITLVVLVLAVVVVTSIASLTFALIRRVIVVLLEYLLADLVK